jgi:hypothetical protein
MKYDNNLIKPRLSLSELVEVLQVKPVIHNGQAFKNTQSHPFRRLNEAAFRDARRNRKIL